MWEEKGKGSDFMRRKIGEEEEKNPRKSVKMRE